MLTAIRGFTQHAITEASDPYLASRTMIPNPVVEFFLLSENYHLDIICFRRSQLSPGAAPSVDLAEVTAGGVRAELSGVPLCVPQGDATAG